MAKSAIVVLGAGPAGLAAAWQAARRGHDVVVIERSHAVGGMAGSFDLAGVRVDHGSHRLHPSIDPRILETLRTLLGDDLQERPRNGRIRLADRWLAFPLSAGDMMRHLPRRFALARDALTAPLRRARADTFAEVVSAGLGPTVYEMFYRPYVEKLWGTPPEQLSGELARRRVSARSPGAVARRILRRSPATGQAFLYPRRGFGQIAEVLADAATRAGAEIRLATEVTGATLSSEGAEVLLGDGVTIDTRRVWSTLPVAALARRVSPPPPDDALAAAGRLVHRGLLLVYLVLDRPRFTEFDAHYFPEAAFATARLSEPKNYRANPDDPGERTVVCAEIPCWEGDERWQMPDDDLGDLVVDDVRRAGLPDVRPAEVAVRRLPRVYPVYRPGFEGDLAALERWVASQPALLTFGRQGLFVPDNTHHALAMGWAAAGALSDDGAFDEAGWRRARDGFRAHVVED